jgi:hypothetical protein
MSTLYSYDNVVYQSSLETNLNIGGNGISVKNTNTNTQFEIGAGGLILTNNNTDPSTQLTINYENGIETNNPAGLPISSSINMNQHSIKNVFQITDVDNSAGTAGQVLTSTGAGNFIWSDSGGNQGLASVLTVSNDGGYFPITNITEIDLKYSDRGTASNTITDHSITIDDTAPNSENQNKITVREKIDAYGTTTTYLSEMSANSFIMGIDNLDDNKITGSFSFANIYGHGYGELILTDPYTNRSIDTVIRPTFMKTSWYGIDKNQLHIGYEAVDGSQSNIPSILSNENIVMTPIELQDTVNNSDRLTPENDVILTAQMGILSISTQPTDTISITQTSKCLAIFCGDGNKYYLPLYMTP